MLRALPVVLVLAVLSLAFAVPAQAVLITVNFTVARDPLDTFNPATANGSFSFDSSIIPSIIPPGGVSIQFPATSGFNLTWSGTTWNDGNTTVGDATIPGLVFDAGGNLIDWFVFGDPNGGNVSSVTPDFWLDPSFGIFLYSAPQASSGLFVGTFTWSTTTGSVPEPASWLLLGGALVGLVGVRRRARK